MNSHGGAAKASADARVREPPQEVAEEDYPKEKELADAYAGLRAAPGPG